MAAIMDELNSYGGYIGSIIIMLVFLVGLIIIIDEIYNITKFCYRYTYLYNYGTLNEATCKDEKLECETARFKIYNEIVKYKFNKDIFSKSWINYAYFVTIIFLSILLCLSFGYLFKHFFIDNNSNCVTNDNGKDADISNWSFIKIIMRCFCGDCHKIIPNCFMSYVMLAILIFVYPMIYILKVIFKIDYTWEAGANIKLFHIAFFIGLLSYIFYLYRENDLTTDKPIKTKILKIIIYIIYITIFYANNYFFATKFNEYTSLSLVSNPNSKSNLEDENNDTTFFDIYRQEEPVKPKEIEKPEFLLKFTYCSSNDFINKANSYCSNINYISNTNHLPYPNTSNDLYIKLYNDVKYKEKIDLLITSRNYYAIDKLIIDDYYEKLNKYQDDMNIYNYKYNIYKNNANEFPEIVYFLFHLCPKMTGIDKKELQLLLILIILVVFITFYLKSNNSLYTNYIYYTIYLYLLGIISISVLINAILIYNTYVNKYLIYEPCHNYKNSLFNKNNILNMAIKNDINLNELYELNTGNNEISKYGITNNNSNLFYIKKTPTDIQVSFDEFLNKVKNKEVILTDANNEFYNLNSPIPPTIFDSNLISVQFKFFKTIYSSFINTTLNLNSISSKILIGNNDIPPYNRLTNYNSTANIHLTIPVLNYSPDNTESISGNDIYYYTNLIKNNFISSENNIKNKIEQLKINYEYYIYSDPTIYTNNISENNNNLLFSNFIDLKKIYDENLIKRDENNHIINNYKFNKIIIDTAFSIYGDFLKDIRRIIISLLNNCNIVCDYTDFIDISVKYNELINKLFIYVNRLNESTYSFKSPLMEPNINIYKKIIINSMKEFNDKYIHYMNLIKICIKSLKLKPDIYVVTGSANVEAIGIRNLNTLNTITNDIIKNYNIYNKDSLRHVNNDFIIKDFNINFNYKKSKYNNMSAINIKKMKISTENVSMSFIILIIIFAIILIEPTVI